jgi:hypothetical protein
MSRGPFERAALLGSDEVAHVTGWIRCGASAHLDVHDPSIAGLATLRRARRRRRLVRRRSASSPDLNFVELPAASYDIIWAAER